MSETVVVRGERLDDVTLRAAIDEAGYEAAEGERDKMATPKGGRQRRFRSAREGVAT